MAGKAKDRTGQVFGKLTVLCKGEPYVRPSGTKVVKWHCKCECGNTVDVRTNSLTSGETTSCGCYVAERLRKVNTTHGQSIKGAKHKYLYTTWLAIKQRCFNPNNTRAYRYSEIGITMYKPWVDNYKAFEDYVISNLGERPKNYSIDRIDNKGHYVPGNIRWASVSQQNANREFDCPGVNWIASENKWRAQISVDNKTIYLGSFSNKEDAILARKEAEDKYW